MAQFSEKSKKQLDTCCTELKMLFYNVIETFDCSVLEGHRSEIGQNSMHENGLSQLKWPDSKHNKTPSDGVDVCPYPVNWHDRDRMILFAGFVLGKAEELEIPLRWGGDWNNNREIKDERFQDLTHFEIVR